MSILYIKNPLHYMEDIRRNHEGLENKQIELYGSVERIIAKCHEKFEAVSKRADELTHQLAIVDSKINVSVDPTKKAELEKERLSVLGELSTIRDQISVIKESYETAQKLYSELFLEQSIQIGMTQGLFSIAKEEKKAEEKKEDDDDLSQGGCCNVM